MTRPSASSLARTILSLIALTPALAIAAHAQTLEYSAEHRDHMRPVAQTLTGPAKLTARLASQRAAISVAVGLFHGGGTRDLLTGYATAHGGALVLQRGAAEAMSYDPSLPAGETAAPFHQRSQAFALPVRPELLLGGDLRGSGHADVLTAQRGDRTVYKLTGDGNGGFLTPQALALRGAVSAIATWTSQEGTTLLVAAVKSGQDSAGQGTGLEFLTLDGEEKGFIPLGAAATAIESARVNNGGINDLLVVAGGKAMVIDGDSLLSSAPNMDTLPVANATALAAGHFLWDRRGYEQMAVLAADATLHILTRPGLVNTEPTAAELATARRLSVSPGGLGTRPQPLAGTGWTDAETVAGMGAGNDAQALLLHGRLTASGTDDLAVLTRGQYLTVSHPTVSENGTHKTNTVVTIDSTASPVTAAVAARLSPDSRLGVITVDSSLHPLLAVPAIHYTYTVTTTTDVLDASPSSKCPANGTATGCSLRDAIAVANADQSRTSSTLVDKINIPAGTYNITIKNSSAALDSQGDVNYHFNLETNVDLVGASCTLNSAGVATACATIIDARAASTQDIAFVINSNIVNAFAPYQVFMSNLQVQDGVNTNNVNGAATGPYTALLGGLICTDVDGSGSLTLNTMVLTGGAVNFGYTATAGGAVGFFNSGFGSTVGSFEMDNSTVTQNRALTSLNGGGIAIPSDVTVTMTNDLVTSNTQAQDGGGLYANASSLNTPSVLTNVTVSGNSSNYEAGGLEWEAQATFNNLILTNNSTAGNNGSSSGGGGAYLSGGNGPTSINYSTITGNKITNAAGDGGAGLFFQGYQAANAPALTLQYSRIYGNTGGLANTTGVALGLAAGSNNGTSRLVAINNWWGCNTDPQNYATNNCNKAQAFGDAGTMTTSPFTTLTLTLNSTTPTANSTITATGSLAQNSAGTVYSAVNDTAYVGVPATISIRQNNGSTALSNTPASTLGSVSSPSSYAGIQAMATASSAGTGLVTVTVDGCTISQASSSTNGTAYACGTAATSNFTVTASDLAVTSTHSPTNFKAGDTADTYTLTVSNVGTASTSGTTTVTDTLPSGFTATAASGSGWTCTVSTGSVTCTSSSVVAASVTFPVITVTVSVSSADVGTYTNNVTVSGGNELNTGNDTASDATIVVGAPTLSEAFSPSTVAPNAASTVTFTVGNPSANSVSLTGVAFSDSLPSGLKVTSAGTTTCSGGAVTAAVGSSAISLSGASIAPGATCTVTAGVASTAIGTYTNTSSAVTASNSNAGGVASATLTVTVTPTRVVYTSAPTATLTAGGNAGTVMVALEDAAGNIATSNSSAAVTLVVTYPNASTQTYTATVTNGVASFPLGSVALTATGTYTYAASASGLTGASASETVNPGAVASLAVTGMSLFTAPQMAGTVTVRAVDAYGNTATGFTGTVTLSSSDSSATLSPASYTFTASDAGTHSFSVTFNTAGTQTLTATSGSVTGAQTGIVVEDAIWILNTSSTLARLTDAGVQTATAGSANGAASYGAIAFDNAGNVWTAANAANAVAEYTRTGTAVTVPGNAAAGVSAPASLFIDGLGAVWIANGNGSLSVLSNTGAAVSPSTGYQPGALSTPTGILVDSSGSVWVTNSGSSRVTKVFGAAAPTVTPLVNGTVNNTLGTRP